MASALNLSSQVTLRRHCLPTDQVLWRVLGVALFRDEPVHEVARHLNIRAQGLASDHLLARSRQPKLVNGSAPVLLSGYCARPGNHWGVERYNDDARHDLPVFVVDGALLRIVDARALRSLRLGNTASDHQTPFPMLRLVALMNVRSHVILDAQ